MAKSRYRRVTCSSRGWVAQVPGLAYQVCQTEELAAAVAAKALGVSVKSLLRMVSWCRRPSVIYHRQCACVGARRAFVHTLEDRCAGPQDQAQVHPLVSRSAMLDLTDAGRRLEEALLPHAESRGSVDKNIAIILVFVGGGEGCGGTSHINIFNLP